ncbi:MAG: extracellular solute-binding protein, partial [Chloroflexota bacterium]|nr:extracellular solute-binding protein [Chloroflexota bacterium]
MQHVAHKIGSGTLSRRQFLTLMSSMAGATALAACAAPAAPGAEGGVNAPTSEAKEVIFWGHDQHPLDLAAEGFVEKYPDIGWVSPHPADWGTKLQAAMAADSDVPDLIWAEATQAQDWGCNDLLTDLTDVLKPVADQYHPLKINETFVAKTGRNVGWPGDISVSGWYYREDKLAEAGYGDVDFETYTWDD